jgi:hypothetical protein
MKLFAFFLLAVLPIAASSSGLESYPGWSLQKIQNEGEDGTYDQRVFYSLTPPDGRPAITIDGRSASRLQAGQTSPEDLYGRRANAKTEDAEEGDEFVYSSSNSKVVVAEGPSEQAKVAEEKPAEKEEAKSSTPLAAAFSSSSTFNAQPVAQGASSGSSAPSSGSTTSSGSSTSGASANESSASAENTAPVAPRVLPVRPGLPEPKRDIAQADKSDQSDSEDDDSEVGGVKASNIKTTGGATGLGFKSKEEKEQEQKEASLPPPPCKAGEKVIDKAAVVRVAIPKGCNNIFVTVWGAGGGRGYSGTRETGGGDNARTVEVRGGSGGGGAFVNGYGSIDSLKYDVVLVVGEGGNDGVAPTRRVVQDGRSNFGTRDDRDVEYEYVGGSNSTGGGLSGLYIIGKSNQSKSTPPDMALVVAGGGGGGGNYNGGGGANGEGHKGQAGGEHPGGNGGNQGGRGGSSFAKLGQGNIEGGNGSKAGFYYYPDRNKAGDPGTDGKIIFKYF